MIYETYDKRNGECLTKAEAQNLVVRALQSMPRDSVMDKNMPSNEDRLSVLIDWMSEQNFIFEKGDENKQAYMNMLY